MSTLSAQLVALNGKTNGKDKIYRTVQYACKLIWYILWKKKSSKQYIEILKRIESSMSSTRKSSYIFYRYFLRLEKNN